MKVLVTDGYSASNIGDLELVAKTVLVCRQRYPDADLVCVATDPDSFLGHVDVEMRESVFSRLSYVHAGAIQKVAFIVRTVAVIAIVSMAALLGKRVLTTCIAGLSPASRSAKRLAAYAGADRVIAVGGGYFANAYLKHSFLTLWVWWIAGKLGAVVETMPVSMEINRGWFKPVVRLLGGSVKWRIRDTHSQRMLTACGLAAPLVPDLAFLNFGAVNLDDPGARRKAILLAPVGGDYLNPAEAADLFEGVAAMIREVFPEHEVFLLAMHSSMQGTHIGGDMLAATQLGDALTRHGKTSRIVAATEYAEVVALCGEMDVVISARMHAGIAALCAGARVGLLAYEEKHTALMGDLSLGTFAIPIRASAKEILELGRRLSASSRDDFIAKTAVYHSQVVSEALPPKR